jgi:hypothetical protein
MVWAQKSRIADELVRREAFERLQAPSEVVGIDEVGEMSPQLVVIVIMVAFDGCILDGAVHSFDLPVCSGMVDFGEPVFDPMARDIAGRSIATKR